jgi:protein-tyrosine phosphatase
VRVWHAPAVDDFDSPPTKPMLEVAIAAANKVVEAIGRGETVLVTCMAGVNRSSLVSGLALHKLLGLSGKDVCAMIQLQRPGTLTNPHFTQCLSNLPQRF